MGCKDETIEAGRQQSGTGHCSLVKMDLGMISGAKSKFMYKNTLAAPNEMRSTSHGRC